MPLPISRFLDRIICADAKRGLRLMPAGSIDCVVTSPPYWQLRDYGVAGQLGLERSVFEYVNLLCDVFDEVRRVMKPTGTLWVNLGDTYSGKRAGLPHKTLLQVPSRFAIAMSERGWLLRNEIIWHKPNVMPQSARDRFTHDFEKLYFFTQSPRYHFTQQLEAFHDRKRLARRAFNPANKYKRKIGDHFVSTINPETVERSRLRMIARGGRNKRSVWRIPNRPTREDHFAAFPPALIRTPIAAGCPRGGTVLDPFAGTGTTAVVARDMGRHFVGFDLNPAYVIIARRRTAQGVLF